MRKEKTDYLIYKNGTRFEIDNNRIEL